MHQKFQRAMRPWFYIPANWQKPLKATKTYLIFQQETCSNLALATIDTWAQRHKKPTFARPRRQVKHLKSVFHSLAQKLNQYTPKNWNSFAVHKQILRLLDDVPYWILVTTVSKMTLIL